MATRRRIGGARRGFRPPTDWTALQSTVLTNIAGATKILAGSFTVGGSTETVRRTRALIHWKSDQLVASEYAIGAFGMCVVSEDAFAAGVASVPGPFTDASSDLWFVHQYILSDFIFGDATGFDSMGGRSYEVDSKAMRRVTDEERIVLVFENGSALGAQFGFAVRLLGSLSRG